jgi:hypothetical protein
MTVAHEIKAPWRDKPSKFWPDGYRQTLVTIWHRDPETDGSDDSCGWFKRARHGDAKILAKIGREFGHEWDSELSGWFDSSGQPVLSLAATTLAMFRRAAYVHFNSSWKRTDRFLRDNLLNILTFSENRWDSLRESLIQKYGETKRTDRIENFAAIVYGCILRWEQPWYRHPRWHVWHWSFQIHHLQAFKRWAFSRCERCGGGFKWGELPCSGSWHGTGPRWFRGEKNIYHSDCSGGGVEAMVG